MKLTRKAPASAGEIDPTPDCEPMDVTQWSPQIMRAKIASLEAALDQARAALREIAAWPCRYSVEPDDPAVNCINYAGSKEKHCESCIARAALGEDGKRE